VTSVTAQSHLYGQVLSQFQGWQAAEVAPDPECRSRLRQDSAFFVRTRIRSRSQKFVKNHTRIQSHFSISAVGWVCVVIFSVKTWANLGWIDDCSQSLNKSRILKFQKLPDPDLDLDSKILEQERSLKKWLWPPLASWKNDSGHLWQADFSCLHYVNCKLNPNSMLWNQRWADCEIFQFESSPDPIKMNPIQSWLQNFWKPSVRSSPDPPV